MPTTRNEPVVDCWKQSATAVALWTDETANDEIPEMATWFGATDEISGFSSQPMVAVLSFTGAFGYADSCGGFYADLRMVDGKVTLPDQTKTSRKAFEKFSTCCMKPKDWSTLWNGSFEADDMCSILSAIKSVADRFLHLGRSEVQTRKYMIGTCGSETAGRTHRRYDRFQCNYWAKIRILPIQQITTTCKFHGDCCKIYAVTWDERPEISVTSNWH